MPMRAMLLWSLALLALVLAGLRAVAPHAPLPLTPRARARALLAPYEARGGEAPVAQIAARPLFTDIASAAGLRFVHDNAARGAFSIPEEMGPGAGFLDYDGDGDLDVFVAGGGRLTAGPGQGQSPGEVQTCRLYRNEGPASGGGVRFSDVTAEAGAGLGGHALGVACADYDDDGDVDVFVTRLGPNALLRNDGDGRFSEVAAAAGLADPGFGTSAAFLDYDRDGHLDLYVANYVRWSPSRDAPCYTVLGVRDYCNPLMYGATTDRLYHNAGDGTFRDVTEAAGIAAETGNGLGVLASDFDGDGWIDLYVANDQTPAFLWHNRGDGTFADTAALSGCAYDARGVAIAGMGVACEDLDGDGDLDLLVTNIHQQAHLVLRNDGGVFEDRSARSGVEPWSIPATGFGVVLFDQDLDGGLEAFFANGDVNVDNRLPGSETNPYAQPDHFMRWTGGRFTDATAVSGVAFGDVGRGAIAGDCDNDGDLDLLVSNNGGPLRLLRNDNHTQGAWLLVDARTGPGHRAAIGARVTVGAGGRTWVREIRPQQSYLCSGDPRAHFGLGAAARVEWVEINWPGGGTSRREDLAIDQVVVIDEEDPEAAR